DRLHGALARHDVHQFEPRARSGALQRRRFEPRPSRGRGRAAQEVSEEMSFLSGVCARASQLGARVAFGEAGDQRVLDAALRLKREGVATPVLVTGPDTVSAEALKLGLECVDPSTHPRAPALADALLKARAKHGMTADEARTLSHDPLAFSIWLVKTGAVDAAVGGAVRTTRELMH